MAELVTLTTPIAKPSATDATLDSLLLDVAGSRIVATLHYNTGESVSKQYDAFTTPTGAALLNSLNISANSVGNSLIKKVYARLSADGVIVGTVSGTPA